MPEHAAFKVNGLDCAEEVAILKREVGRLEGIEALVFDILNARMTAAFDPEAVSRQDIVDAVAAGGMTAVPWEERSEEEGPFWREHDRLVMTSLSGTFLLAGFVTHWAIHGSIVDALLAGETGADHVFPPLSVLFYVSGAVAGA
jgi:Cd2+/Zn2+-exporting ATPase